MNPRRIGPNDPALQDVLALIRTCFAEHDGVVDPPSSMHRMTLETLQNEARQGEVWSTDLACMILTPQPATLYLGKLAVAPQARRKGLARGMIRHAITRAQALDLPCLTLQSRVELRANHALFGSMGFVETDRTAHPGYDRPTSLTFTLPL